MYHCPSCDAELVQQKSAVGILWVCPSCGGRAATVSLLRKLLPGDVVNTIWRTAKTDTAPRRRACPSCGIAMPEILLQSEPEEHLDVCTTCHFVWFDTREYEALPKLTQSPSRELDNTLPQAARERLAVLQVEQMAEEARQNDWIDDSPTAWWHWIAGFFGMPVEQGDDYAERLPWATWGLAVFTIAVSVLAFMDLNNAVMTLGFIPAEWQRYGGFTPLTSFFLHSGPSHLMGNMYFLLVFGDNVERELGPLKFFALLLLATLAGDALHASSDVQSLVPCIGASGGISGVLAFYALKFPKARLGFMFWYFFTVKWVYIPVWVLFIFWILLQLVGVGQQLAGQSNVSALAHLGGVGIAFWLMTKAVPKRTRDDGHEGGLRRERY